MIVIWRNLRVKFSVLAWTNFTCDFERNWFLEYCWIVWLKGPGKNGVLSVYIWLVLLINLCLTVEALNCFYMLFKVVLFSCFVDYLIQVGSWTGFQVIQRTWTVLFQKRFLIFCRWFYLLLTMRLLLLTNSVSSVHCSVKPH